MNEVLNKQYDVFKYGCAWVKADFHFHTKVDKQFTYTGNENQFVNQYIEKLKEAEVKIGVITNHNKFDRDEFKSLRKKALQEEIYLLAGVELSVKEGQSGVHTIIVFSDEWFCNKENKDYINDFITSTFSGSCNFENDSSCSNDNLETTLARLEKFGKDYFLVFAHVEDDKGLWKELKGNLLEKLGENETFIARTKGFQSVKTTDANGTERPDRPDRTKVKNHFKNAWYPAEVEGSDCKSLDEIVSKSKPCFLKIGDFTYEAVKYALSAHSVRVSKKQGKHSRTYIKSIKFDGGSLSNNEIFFSAELNTLIGIRGSGKSSIIDSLRYVLDLPLSEKSQEDKYQRELIRHTLKSGGKITIKAIGYLGQEYEVCRILNEQPEVYSNSVLIPGISIKETVIKNPIYFGQKDLSNSGDGFEKDLVEKLVGERLSDLRRKIDDQKRRVQDAVKRYLKLSNIDDKIKEYTDKKSDMEHRLEKFKQYKIEEKLQKQIDFETDSRQCSNILTSVKSFVDNIEDLLAQHEDELKNQQKYQSKQNNSFFIELYKTYSGIIKSVDDLKGVVSKAKTAQAALAIKESEFNTIKSNFKEEFARVERELSNSLQAAGQQSIRPDEFKQASKILDQSINILEELVKEKSKADQVKNDLIKEMSTLNQQWREEFLFVKQELDKVNHHNSSLVIKNDFKGDKTPFVQFLKDNFRGSSIKEITYQRICKEYPDFHELFKSNGKAKEILGNSWQTFEEYFIRQLDVFLMWRTPDKFTIEYQGKEISEHSIGQRASAMILFVLSQQENDVIIIDQPEDDLDNQTIYQDVIKLLKSLKPETQFIFATHNPNIPVLGDAEQVVSCKYSNDTITLNQGSIDRPIIQQEIVGIMEGGKEAFDKRKEIYDIWKPSNF